VDGRPGQFPADPHAAGKTSRFTRFLVSGDTTGRTSGACPGYVVDHVTPLKRGADRPENMQWQTTAAGKAKDKRE
jgi:hypothetical protein